MCGGGGVEGGAEPCPGPVSVLQPLLGQGVPGAAPCGCGAWPGCMGWGWGSGYGGGAVGTAGARRPQPHRTQLCWVVSTWALRCAALPRAEGASSFSPWSWAAPCQHCVPPPPRHGSGAGWSGSCGSCGCRRSATSCSAWRGARAMPGRCRTRSHPWAGRTGGAPPSSPSPSPATPCSQCPVVPCHRGTSGGAEGVHEGRGCPTAVPVSPCPQGPQPDRGGHGTQRLPAAPGRGLPRGAGPELRPRSARPRGHGAGRGRRGRCHVHRGRWERARGTGWVCT